MKLILHEVLKYERSRVAAKPKPRTEWRSFLVPIDFTDGSREALKLAVSLAADPEDQITLLHVIQPESWMQRTNEVALTLRKPDGDQIEESDSRLRRWAALEAGPDIEINTLVRIGSPLQEIINAAATCRSDAIVLSEAPSHWIGRLFRSPLSAQLAKVVSSAVITIRASDSRPPSVQSFDPTHAWRSPSTPIAKLG